MLIHYLNQYWLIDNWTKLQWKFNHNLSFFFQENAFENAVCKMSAILFEPHCGKSTQDRSLTHCVNQTPGNNGIIMSGEIHMKYEGITGKRF